MPIDPKRIRPVFQKLESDLAQLSARSEPKSVHRFRTGTRRLQILLGELSPKLDGNEKKLLKMLGKIRKRAGKVRDLDVQAAALRSLKMPREPRRKTQLVNLLIELRGKQEKKLRKAVDRESVRELRKRLKRAAKHFDPALTRDPLSIAHAMLDRLNRAGEPLTEAVLHQYRILSKKARYATEFATPTPDALQFIAELKRIQDALGDWHDWLTLTQSAQHRLGEVSESPLVAELHNVTGAKYRNAVAVITRSRNKSNTDAAAKVQRRVPVAAAAGAIASAA